ncbi:hypothetical protein [Nocardia jinanensis]|uniref:hypothetical protein n=1 Tax=Nocardia jinanensis TaxID=382504 RepID=UPI000AE6D570|nr:hypothetical protein [Nocardia jinanensis]
MSSFLSFLTLMLVLPGMAAAAAWVSVAVSVWLESRRASEYAGSSRRPARGRI